MDATKRKKNWEKAFVRGFCVYHQLTLERRVWMICLCLSSRAKFIRKNFNVWKWCSHLVRILHGKSSSGRFFSTFYSCKKKNKWKIKIYFFTFLCILQNTSVSRFSLWFFIIFHIRIRCNESHLTFSSY